MNRRAVSSSGGIHIAGRRGASVRNLRPKLPPDGLFIGVARQGLCSLGERLERTAQRFRPSTLRAPNHVPPWKKANEAALSGVDCA